jgi:glutaredoxin
MLTCPHCLKELKKLRVLRTQAGEQDLETGAMQFSFAEKAEFSLFCPYCLEALMLDEPIQAQEGLNEGVGTLPTPPAQPS